MNSKEQRIHISEIDEFLAHGLAVAHMRAFKLALSKEGDQGYLKARISGNDGLIEDEGVDFELSPGENKGVDDFEISDFVRKAVYTSSAYELFDFIFAYLNSIECVVDFRENAWLVKVVKTN
jgi:hypothetical protein